MKTVKAFTTLRGVQIGVEGHRSVVLPEHWVIDRSFVCGPPPQIAVTAAIGYVSPQDIQVMETALTAKEAVDAQNAETSRRELESFKNRTSDKWYGYFHGTSRTIQTWAGDKLADVVWVGRIYRVPCFGGYTQRFNFRANGVDGRSWAGTAYTSSGDYVRMRVVKK